MTCPGSSNSWILLDLTLPSPHSVWAWGLPRHFSASPPGTRTMEWATGPEHHRGLQGSMSPWLGGAWQAHPLSPAEMWNEEVLSQSCESGSWQVCLSPAQQTEPCRHARLRLPRRKNSHQPRYDLQETWCQPLPLALLLAFGFPLLLQGYREEGSLIPSEQPPYQDELCYV